MYGSFGGGVETDEFFERCTEHVNSTAYAVGFKDVNFDAKLELRPLPPHIQLLSSPFGGLQFALTVWNGCFPVLGFQLPSITIHKSSSPT